MAVHLNTQGPCVYTSGGYSNPEADGTLALPASVQIRPWGDPEYRNLTTTTTAPNPVRTKPSNTVPTSSYLIIVNPTSTPTVPANSGSFYLVAVPPVPKIDFSRPTPTSSKTTPAFEIKIGTQGARSSGVRYMSVPKWRYRPPPTITGVTVRATSIPENLISTFFGGLGWARTKGYVIPVNSNGVSGWHKVVATRSPREFAGPNQVSGSMTGPDFPSRLQAPPMNSSMPQKTIFLTSDSNITYHDNLKIAAIQAFAQLGVVLLAVLIVIVAAVAFVCFSSILRWPMKVLHAMRRRDVDMLKEMFVPAKFRKAKGGEIEKQERTDVLGGFVRSAGTGEKYLRGTAEAVMFDAVEPPREGTSTNISTGSSTNTSAGSLTNTSAGSLTNTFAGSSTNISAGSFSLELSKSTTPAEVGASAKATHDRNIPLAVAAVSTGSQSKAEGSKLRIVNQPGTKTIPGSGTNML